MYSNNINTEDPDDTQPTVEDNQLIFISSTRVSLQKIGLFMQIMVIMIYLMAYSSMTSEEKSYLVSRIFSAYIVFSMINTYVLYLNYKRDLLVVDHPVSRQFYSSLLTLNKWPMSLLKLSKLATLGIGLYFCSLFLVGCGPYSNGTTICRTLRLISIQELLVPVFILLYYACILVQLCSIMGRHRAQHQARNQLMYYFGENLTMTTVGESDNTNDGSCVICQNDTVRGEQWKVLPCGHGFHPECIDQWLVRNNICPICRRVLPVQQI